MCSDLDYTLMKSFLDQVKGYINEMAVRLEDEDERISNLAKLFFIELSKKGFDLYYDFVLCRKVSTIIFDI